MPRLSYPPIATAAILALAVILFAPILFRGQLFGFRDATQYYYPLYQEVQRQWESGRLPLWDPGQNAGQPLLGNPTAAVLYPGKLTYASLPYPWATRVYAIGHVVLAALGMGVLLRSWRVGAAGSTLAALSYGFGAPIVFQVNNIIYLVGASWVPWVIWGAGLWIEGRDRRGLAIVAIGLAMQVLGGEPQSAYLCGLSAVAWCLVRAGESWLGGRRQALLAAGLILGLLMASLAVAAALPRWRESPTSMSWAGRAWWLALGVAGTALFVRWRRVHPELSRGLAGLLAAGILGSLLAGVQVLPSLDFAAGSTRAANVEGLDRYGFSLIPYRMVELVWPNVFGLSFPENRGWIRTLKPFEDHVFWTPSLYLGGLTVVMAIAGLFGTSGSPERRSRVRWLGLLVIASLLASFGKHAGPVGLTRWVPAVVPALSGYEAEPGGPTKPQSDVRDADGSPYWWMAATLPGFGLFRYPSKLLTFTAFGVSALAGLGWERTLGGRRRPATIAAASLLALSLVALGVAVATKSNLVAAWAESSNGTSPDTGPLRPEPAFEMLRWGLSQGVILFAAALVLARLASSKPRLAGVAAVGLMVGDLGLANAPLIWTVPEAALTGEPKALEVIRRAEEREPPDGPFRIHRPSVWRPIGMFRAGSPDRVAETAAWERDTLQPLHGLPLGIQYTTTVGIFENDRYLQTFQPTPRPIGPALAGVVGLEADYPVLYFPRRGFDFWNTRYFVLPVVPLDWRQENRAFASFLDRVQMLAPGPEVQSDPERKSAWWSDQDWQVFRNEAAFPRAWIVHEARRVRPFDGLDDVERAVRLRALLYNADPIWNEPGRAVVDLRREAWVELAEGEERTLPSLAPPPPGASEAVEIVRYEPDRVELEASLAAPGLVVLSDVDARGWTLTIDDEPASIFRANHLMRAAFVPRGRHRLVYRYRPLSLAVGIASSAVGLFSLLGLAAWAWRQPHLTPGAGLATGTNLTMGPPAA